MACSIITWGFCVMVSGRQVLWMSQVLLDAMSPHLSHLATTQKALCTWLTLKTKYILKQMALRMGQAWYTWLASDTETRGRCGTLCYSVCLCYTANECG